MEKRALVLTLIIVSILIGAAAYGLLAAKDSETESSSLSGTTPARLELRTSSDKTVYGLNESINVSVTLENTGDESINVSQMGLEWGTLDFELSTPDGRVLRSSGPFVNCMPRAVILLGHHSIELTFNVKNLFMEYNDTHEPGHINQTGTYHLQFIYRSWPTYEDVWEGTVYSNTISFTIKPEV